jgi:RimJ/RimL family protein N-acetyltransferase
MQVTLHRAREEDIDWIMRLERLPGYDNLVGCWDAAQHRAAMADPTYRYFRAEADGRPAGFVIVKGWDSPDHVTLIKRAAIETPGSGVGRRMIAAAVARVFEDTSAYRLWIGCFPDNLRARQAYEAAGFTAEGVARGNAYFHGEHRDELVLSILRPEWERRHRL